MKKTFLLSLISILLNPLNLFSQTTTIRPNCPDGMGAWYMYFMDLQFEDSRWGLQLDLQHRNFDLGGDMEQIMIRGGATYRPENTKVKLTLGLASITSGEFGDGKSKSMETRIYQEAIIPNKIGNRVYLKHRFRYEQRLVDEDDFRTRYRYNVFLDIPLNSKAIEKNTVYFALYNELFINGRNTKTSTVFDRNRSYAALGYGIKDNLKVQAGIMRQSTTDCYKDQLQLSLHYKI